MRSPVVVASAWTSAVALLLILPSTALANEPDEDAPPAGPRKLRAVEGLDPPEGYVEQTGTFQGLWIAGLASFVPVYMVTAVLSLGANPRGSAKGIAGAVPFVGPFIAAGLHDDSGDRLLYTVVGLVQVTSLSMFVVGLATPRKFWVRKDVGASEPALAIGPASGAVRVSF